LFFIVYVFLLHQRVPLVKLITMGGSPAENNAVVEFLHFGETSSAASEVSPGGRNHGGRNPPSFAGSTARSVSVAVRPFFHPSWVRDQHYRHMYV
jgi:hypothetical protein